MDPIRFREHDAPAVKDPIFIEGLPGVGNVGKLAADHLVDVLRAKKWLEIQSRDFPPQVMVQPDGTIRPVNACLWVAPGAAAGRDLVLLTGDFQPMSPEGQYAFVEGVLERLSVVGCKELYTLGGYGLGSSVDEPRVLGAATDLGTVERLQGLGVQFEEDEPGGGIIGASGLFLGLGVEQGLRGACLMGETSGFMVDPKAARAVLEALSRILDLSGLDLDDLEERAEEVDRIATHLRDAESPGRSDTDHYIG